MTATTAPRRESPQESSRTAADLTRRIRSRTSSVAIIGLGYVGLPLAVHTARAGFTVFGIEENPRRAALVNKGVSYIPDVISADLGEQVAEGRLQASRGFEAIAEADVILICVPTPLGKNKDPDIQFVEKVTAQSAPFLRRGQLLVLESTTYPGTTEEVVVPKVEARGLRVGQDIFVAYSPERIDPGNRTFNLANTPKVAGGVTRACTRVAATFYRTALGTEVHTVSSPRAAELVKLLENVYRVVNVSLVNEIARLCDRMGLDVWEVIEAAKTKPYGFTPFYPGPGMGGHCIPIDPFYLAWKAKEYDFTTRFIELAGEINDAQPGYVVEQAIDLLNERGRPLSGSRILLLGVAYKKGTSDTRESPALKVAQGLRRRGAHIQYHDPHVPEVTLDGEVLRSVELTPEVLRNSHLVLVATDHTDVDYRFVVSHARLIYDTRNALQGIRSRKVRRLGAGTQAG